MGGNRGPVEEHLAFASRQLAGCLEGFRVSSLYRTAPVSPLPQDDYLNLAIVGRTALSAAEVLALGKALEHAAGRRRGVRFGPRPLDVDLLLYGNEQIDLPELTVPHPRLPIRHFVLQPLSEIAPGLTVPPAGRTIAELLAALSDEPGITPLGRALELSAGKGMP